MEVKKVNLIFPIAGEAVRFGGTFKPFLNIGDKTFIEVTYNPFKKWEDKIKNIYFICTQEQEDAYNVTAEIKKLINHNSIISSLAFSFLSFSTFAFGSFFAGSFEVVPII